MSFKYQRQHGRRLLYLLGLGIFIVPAFYPVSESFLMSHWICLGLAFIICTEPRFNINVIVQGSEMYLRKVQIKVPHTNCLFV